LLLPRAADTEDTVTVATYSPSAKTYRTDRYLLGSDAMGKMRTIKKANGDRSCSADTNYLMKLSAQLEALRAALPAQPNERLVYGCGAK
jgi:serine protease Do